MKTIDKIITKVDTRRGAPMGRANVYPKGYLGFHSDTKLIGVQCEDSELGAAKAIRYYDCKVPMTSDNAYDIGGAYWGSADELRVRYTKDLSFVEFYRKHY